jgi:hypothetical protein
MLWLYPPDRAPVAVALPDTGSRLSIGRDPNCHVVIEHASVSRVHAQLELWDAGWLLTDQGSKNGMRVGGHAVRTAVIQPGQWFSLGDVMATLEPMTRADWSTRESGIERRRVMTGQATGRIANASSADELFSVLLRSFVDIAGCRRGFLLSGDLHHGLVVRACLGVEPDLVGPARFEGSSGVIERAMSEHRCLVVGNALSQPWARARASIVGQGIRAVACMPLAHDDVAMGVVYADTDDSERRFEQLDVDMLEALGAQASLILAALRLTDRLEQVDRCLVLGAEGLAGAISDAPRWAGQRAS